MSGGGRPKPVAAAMRWRLEEPQAESDVTPAPPPAHIAPAPADRFGFQSAWLGESMGDWRAHAPPAVTCATQARVTTCSAPPQPLGGGYEARNLTYRFVDGQLARISFRTSVDGFSWVTARLDGRYGRPDSILRDDIQAEALDIPHVQDTWRNGRSTIVLDDPTGDLRTLRVTYSLDALASALPAT
jgi:hypothetical protein